MLFRKIFIGLIVVYLFSGCAAIRVLKKNAYLIAKNHPNDTEAQANLREANTVGVMPQSSGALLDVGIGALAIFFPAAGAIAAIIKKKTAAINLAKEVAEQAPEDARKTLINSKVAV